MNGHKYTYVLLNTGKPYITITSGIQGKTQYFIKLIYELPAP